MLGPLRPGPGKGQWQAEEVVRWAVKTCGDGLVVQTSAGGGVQWLRKSILGVQTVGADRLGLLTKS